jgi:hypothetical protein
MAIEIIGVPSVANASSDVTLFVDRNVDPAQLGDWQLSPEDFVEAEVARYGQEQTAALRAASRIGYVSLEAMKKPAEFWLSHWLEEGWSERGIEVAATRVAAHRLTEFSDRFKKFVMYADKDDSVALGFARSIGLYLPTWSDQSKIPFAYSTFAPESNKELV